MWNRPVLFLWVSLRMEGRHRFRFAWPLPVFALYTLLDVACDWGAVAKPFLYGRGRRKEYGIFRGVVTALSEWFWELMFRTGPMTLAEIDLGEGEKRFSLKCCLK